MTKEQRDRFLQEARDTYDCDCPGVPCPEVRAYITGAKEAWELASQAVANDALSYMSRMIVSPPLERQALEEEFYNKHFNPTEK